LIEQYYFIDIRNAKKQGRIKVLRKYEMWGRIMIVRGEGLKVKSKK